MLQKATNLCMQTKIKSNPNQNQIQIKSKSSPNPPPNQIKIQIQIQIESRIRIQIKIESKSEFNKIPGNPMEKSQEILGPRTSFAVPRTPGGVTASPQGGLGLRALWPLEGAERSGAERGRQELRKSQLSQIFTILTGISQDFHFFIRIYLGFPRISIRF